MALPGSFHTRWRAEGEVLHSQDQLAGRFASEHLSPTFQEIEFLWVGHFYTPNSFAKPSFKVKLAVNASDHSSKAGNANLAAPGDSQTQLGRPSETNTHSTHTWNAPPHSELCHSKLHTAFY